MNKNIKMLERISPGLWRGSDYIYQNKIKKKRWAVLKNKEEGKGFGREKNKRMWTPVSLRGMRSRKGICDWSSVLDCSSNLVWVISAFMLFHNTPARALHHKATRYSNPPPPPLPPSLYHSHKRRPEHTQFTSEPNSTSCPKKMTHKSTKKPNTFVAIVPVYHEN